MKKPGCLELAFGLTMGAGVVMVLLAGGAGGACAGESRTAEEVGELAIQALVRDDEKSFRGLMHETDNATVERIAAETNFLQDLFGLEVIPAWAILKTELFSGMNLPEEYRPVSAIRPAGIAILGVAERPEGGGILIRTEMRIGGKPDVYRGVLALKKQEGRIYVDPRHTALIQCRQEQRVASSGRWER